MCVFAYIFAYLSVRAVPECGFIRACGRAYVCVCVCACV